MANVPVNIPLSILLPSKHLIYCVFNPYHMKSYISTLFILSFIKVAYSQNRLQEKGFIRQVVARKNIVYRDSLSQASADYLHHHLKYANELAFARYDADSVVYIDSAEHETRMLKSKAMPLILGTEKMGSISARLVPIIRDTIILSSHEIAFIISGFEKDNKRKWDKDLLPEARQINADTIRAVFEDRIWGWQKMHNKGVSSIYTFGPPVFIRGGKYCIFYSDNTCGYRCGSGKLAIYRIENGKWTFWADITTWVS